MSEKRPAPIQTEEQLANHISHPFDDQSVAALAIQLSADDVVVSTFPKCGTTWAGQIVHGLRSGGDMEFADLGKVMPWFEMGHLFGHDVYAPQAFAPRIYKSHMALSEVPKGGKVINIVRNPGDTLVSFYNFWSGVLIDPSSITLDMMARQFFLLDHSDNARNMFRLNYFQHLVDFHTADYDGPVLFIAYEDMKVNLPAAVRRIARFMGLDISRTLETKVCHQASFEFMARHKAQFSEKLPNGEMEMVVTGRVGDAKEALSPELQDELEAAWTKYVTPMLGYKDYEQLRQAISLT
jgi:hypothetical protein